MISTKSHMALASMICYSTLRESRHIYRALIGLWSHRQNIRAIVFFHGPDGALPRDSLFSLADTRLVSLRILARYCGCFHIGGTKMAPYVKLLIINTKIQKTFRWDTQTKRCSFASGRFLGGFLWFENFWWDSHFQIAIRMNGKDDSFCKVVSR